jgi:hypothetical protein
VQVCPPKRSCGPFMPTKTGRSSTAPRISGMSVRRHTAGGILSTVLDDPELEAIEARCEAASPGPWRSLIEGRDHWSGDDFIRVSDSDGQPDMYVSRATDEGLRPASPHDLDFIAAARHDVPRLVAEIRRLRSPSSMSR